MKIKNQKGLIKILGYVANFQRVEKHAKGHKSKYEYQENRLDNPEINSCSHSELIFDDVSWVSLIVFNNEKYCTQLNLKLQVKCQVYFKLYTKDILNQYALQF